MKFQQRRLVVFVVGIMLVVFVAACDEAVDDNTTPTVAPTITPNQTEIALLWTSTPSPTASITSTTTLTPSTMPSLTTTPSLTVTSSITPSVTATASVTSTQTPSATLTQTTTSSTTPTATFTATDTLTPSPTSTATATVTQTPSPTLTPTNTLTTTTTPSPSRTLTATATAFISPTPSVTPTLTPTFTPSATTTRTPTSTSSPTATATPSITLTPTATATQTRAALATRPPTTTPSPTVTATLTGFPTITPTLTPFPSVTRLPTSTLFPGITLQPPDEEIPLVPNNNVTILPFATSTPIRINTPLPVNTQVVNTQPPAQGTTGGGNDAIVITSADGVLIRLDGSRFPGFENATAFDYNDFASAAYFGGTNEIFVNGQPLRISPANEFGAMSPDLRATQVAVSPSGRYVAFVLESDSNFNQFGVWVVDIGTNQSWQMYRNDLSQSRRATRILWAPNSTYILIQLSTPAGSHYTVLPIPEGTDQRNNQANAGYNLQPFEDAVVSLDNRTVIVSGLARPVAEYGIGEGWILGRINLLYPSGEYPTPFTAYDFASAGISFTRAAADIGGAQIAFLGSTSSEGPYRLYVVTPPGVPVAVSGEIPGRVLSWDWSPGHSSLLVTTTSGRLYLVRTNGSIADLGPAPRSARWR